MEKTKGTYKNMLYYTIQAFLYIWCIFIFTNILVYFFFFSGLISLGTPPNRSYQQPQVAKGGRQKSIWIFGKSNASNNRTSFCHLEYITSYWFWFFFISTPKSSTLATHISILYSTSTFCHIILRILTRSRTYNSQVYKAQ